MDHQKIAAAESEKEKAIRDKQKAEQDKQNADRQKEEAIRNKQKAEQDKENANKEKEKAIKDKQKAEQDKEKAGKEKENAIKDKEKAEKEKEEALKEKQDAIEELNKLKAKENQDTPELKKSVLLQAGFKGFISAVTNADYAQEVILVMKKNNPEKTRLSVTLLEGQGKGIQMQSAANNREYKPFGPLNEDATVEITLRHGTGSISSKMVSPLSVHKESDNNYPMEFLISTVICADGVDTSYGDCMVHVVQYK